MPQINELSAVPFDEWWVELAGDVLTPVLAWAVTGSGGNMIVEPVIADPISGQAVVQTAYVAIRPGFTFGDVRDIPGPA